MAELLEFLTTLFIGLWVALMAVAWVRFEKLPHGRSLYIAAWFWPLLLVDDLLRLTGPGQWKAILSGAFGFMPVLMMVLIVSMVYPLLREKPMRWKPLLWLGVGIVAACQIPVLILAPVDKMNLLMQQPIGQPLANLPVYLVYWLSGMFIVAMGIKLVELMQAYQRTLSEQVVDINYYRVPTIIGLTATLVGLGFAAIVLTTMVAFNFVQFTWWQTTIHYSYALVFLMVLILLLERRRFSPSPLDMAQLAARKGDENALRYILAKAEKAMIERKAYKVIGLRIRQLADAADVEPTTLAIATHRLLNRNFRAFVYHYRLEYAKKVLMRTDSKVSAVAKRLGFQSEKFLSDMFIKYIEVMGVKEANEFDDPIDNAPDNPLDDPVHDAIKPRESNSTT